MCAVCGVVEERRMKMDTDYTPNLVCPYCGYINQDSWEVNIDEGLEWDSDVDCGGCEKTFRASKYCTIRYSTKQKEGV
jgi:hypothetical protein